MLSVGTLANIKHILQKSCFDATNEKILSVCTVTKTYKKKKVCYLVLILTQPHNSPWICQIKQERDGDYKKKRSWSIHELKYVDGKNENPDTHEFDMMLDKLYKWYAINLHERQNFLVQLYNQMKKFEKNSTINIERAEIKNIPKLWIINAVESFDKNEDGGVNQQGENESKKTLEDSVNDGNIGDVNGEVEDSESHALTDKEISDLTKLVSECDFAIKDAELFIEQLGKKLSDLDRANIQSFLTSEMKVIKLLEEVEKAIQEASGFEERLDSYDEILSHVRETMEKMGGKNAMIEIANTNNMKLLNELHKVITQLDIPYNYQQALMDPDLKSESGREAAIIAGKALLNAMNYDIDAPLLRLTAVQDQKKRFEKWKAKYSQTISRHLNNLFIHLGNDMGESHIQSSTELTLPNRSAIHKELSVYTELMHWTKAMDKKSYDGLVKVYTSSLGKIYDRDVRYFFAQARQIISLRIHAKGEDLDASGSGKSGNLSASGGKLTGNKQPSSVPYGLLGANRDLWSSAVDPVEREKFDAILERVLTELEPFALEEQMFCINFFQLDVISPNTSKTTTPTSADTTSSTTFAGTGSTYKDLDTDAANFPQRKIDRQINEEVRKMMMSLFGVLEYELIAFIENFEKLDNFYTMYVLVRLTQHVMSAQDTHSFLSMTFASALVHVKRNFDKYMQQQLQSIKESKVPKRSKCGILPYVENFEEFAMTSENIFKKSTRRTDIDKWYVQIVNTIFEYISVHAFEHPKTPSQVIKMENYHHMFALLAQLKIPILEQLKKDAKVRYNEALKSYVIKYFGRPLEKLNQFFEGVQQKVTQGVKENEISYQMAYSKQELRKVISLYPAKEVKKGLENLYKKVEKHLCEEENLLQVVWHAMQEEFIAQYNFLEERIQKCYAGAMINLDFTIHDILQFFSDIARSH